MTKQTITKILDCHAANAARNDGLIKRLNNKKAAFQRIFYYLQARRLRYTYALIERLRSCSNK